MLANAETHDLAQPPNAALSFDLLDNPGCTPQCLVHHYCVER